MAAEPPISPDLKAEIEKIDVALHRSIVATLTAAVASSGNRPHSAKEAVETERDLWWSMYQDAATRADHERVKAKQETPGRPGKMPE